ncbi:Ger(x)C family spore germination protein [Oceanobacillus halophilus]|uniref:Ger(X)C family spore germination protein n=1 Tax=Oceanobacillus halophilus TaxID=930130 RepID=A0A494ZSN6_9BACI|nr:Ger(x)C family spore germination protein [Oceanobacillus halophilus]RKQ28551.1 Ger(x)C family spore germination protein [Oceanobacillus halophilus]
MKRIPLLFGILLVLSGCWDRYELEERANLLGLAIDVATEEDMEKEPSVTHKNGEFPDREEDDYIKLTAQISLPGKIKLGPEGGGGEGSKKNAWVLETVGHTIKDAMANLQQQLAEKLYLGHVQIIVISEEIAEKGVTEINDFLRRNPEVRRTSWMVINGGDAKEVLEAAPPVESVPSLYLSNTLDNAVRQGKLPREYLGKFWIDLADIGIDPMIPSIKVEDKDRILVDGMNYFKGDRMVGKFSPIEIGVYMSVMGENQGGYSYAVKLPEEEGIYMIKATERDSKIMTELKNGEPRASIDITIDSIIEEETKTENLNQNTVRKIEQEAEEKAKKLGDEFVKNLQEDGSDVFGLGARIRAKHKNYWNEEIKTNDKWTETYKEMDIKVTYNINIKRTGMEWK